MTTKIDDFIKRVESTAEEDLFTTRTFYHLSSLMFHEMCELLKEQEAIPVDTKVIGTFNGDVEVYCCRDCRTILDPAFHYCPNCGQEVKWDG